MFEQIRDRIIGNGKGGGGVDYLLKRKHRVGCRHSVPLRWVIRLVMVQMRLTKVQLGNVRDVDKRQISLKV